MQFLANENFPKPSIFLLRQNNINIVAISERSPGLTDKQVMEIAVNEKRIILTHDSDYGELIFKLGYKPQEGVIFFRLFNFEAADPGKILLQLIQQNFSFERKLTVIGSQTIRQRPY